MDIFRYNSHLPIHLKSPCYTKNLPTSKFEKQMGHGAWGMGQWHDMELMTQIRGTRLKTKADRYVDIQRDF